jgi:acyl-CoA oxidase
MGLFCNHALVQARLIIDGMDYGVQPFIVETRDPNTHLLLPGIEAGDIGPKYGYNSKENGYMIFHDVKIPRTNMVPY